jgi:carboxylate-amine ligase
VAEAFVLDAVPRLIPDDEWSPLARGLAQRVRALDRFVADVYAEGEIVAAGVVPDRALESCDHFEPLMVGLPPAPVRIAVAGLDVVRGARGRFGVLEDNLRTPSGMAYALAARECVDAQLPAWLAEGRRSLDEITELLRRTLREAAPEDVTDPTVVMLSDGPGNSAWYEHERLAQLLDIPIVALEDLSIRGGRLLARVGRTRLRVDVLYRRTDEDRLTDASGELTEVGAKLWEPMEKGKLSCVNAFGTGVADDKLLHAYVEDMVRFYLGEEPLVPSVTTYDPEMSEHRDAVLDRIDELVIKPRTGHGGHGVVVAPHAHEDDVRAAHAAVHADPGAFIAQETVMISTHPTVIGDHLEPRHVDLRPFVLLAGDEARVVPGGLTRVALDRGALVVNSSQRGGGKDTWVMA